MVDSLPPFEEFWKDSILPLVGTRLAFDNGGNMELIKVGWEGVTRKSVTGRQGLIPIEPFLWTVEQLRRVGRVTRAEINQQFDDRYTDAVMLILAQAREIALEGHPRELVLTTGEGSGG